ncbi:hypothetical protein MASR2M117_17290 [Paludibacter sp.]
MFFLLLTQSFSYSQISDSFSDGNFTQNPEWVGTSNNFKINSLLQLQSSASVASTSYLFTHSQAVVNAEWECSFRIEYPTSSSNYACMYIISDSCSIENGFNGYFVQVGGTNDEVSLFYQNNTKKEKIIDGLDKRTDSKIVEVTVKVTRDSLFNFRLYSKLKTENEFYFEGEVNHPNIKKSTYFGLSFTNTATTGSCFIFDDISVKGNIYSDLTECKEIEEGDIVFNEVMFNNPESSAEYVEFFNRSDKIIDVSGLIFTTRKSDGSLNSGIEIPYTTILKPGDYLALTAQKDSIKRYHNCPDNANIVQTKWSTLNNESATLVLTNTRRDVVYDEFTYHESFHHPLIRNPKGVALERVFIDIPTQDSKNWHSAATTNNYGTPGFKNSQYRLSSHEHSADEFSLDSKFFSPDNDGQNDVCVINYTLPKAGYIANIEVFTPNGIHILKLSSQFLCAQEGNFIWDGSNKYGRISDIGIYVLYIEVFHPESGDKKRVKIPIVLSSR